MTRIVITVVDKNKQQYSLGYTDKGGTHGKTVNGTGKMIKQVEKLLNQIKEKKDGKA